MKQQNTDRTTNNKWDRNKKKTEQKQLENFSWPKKIEKIDMCFISNQNSH